MSIARIKKAIEIEVERNVAESLAKTTKAGVNPLRQHKMTCWFQKSVAQANNDYTATFDRKKQLLELAELFNKFDVDGSGTLDLDELVELFKSAGLRVSSKRLKEMFYLPKNVEIINNELNVEQFQKLMLSPELEKAFRTLLTDIRSRVKHLDFSMVDPTIGFLPSDLRLMLGYLYKRSVHQTLQNRIVSDKLKTTNAMTSAEVENTVDNDLMMFSKMFSMHDDNNYDSELRQRYRVAPFERKFRKEQSPSRRVELKRLNAITTFFLKRIRDIAVSHSKVKNLVDKSILTQKIPPIHEQRQMKMATDTDRIEVSIENISSIKVARKEFEEYQRQQSNSPPSQYGNIMRALTITQSNSQTIRDDVFSSTPGVSPRQNTLESADPPQAEHDTLVGWSTQIADKEERVMYEMLQSLTENLEVLDSVREVFEREDLIDGTTTEQTSRVFNEGERSNDNDGEVRFLESVPETKRVAKGRAVFIVPDKNKIESPEERMKRRDEMIAKLLADNTGQVDVENGIYITEQAGNASQEFEIGSSKRKQIRNSSQLVYSSQMDRGIRSHQSRIDLTNQSGVSILGRSVINGNRSRLLERNNPLKEQLELEAKDLIAELLEKNNDYQLTEYQKTQLEQLRNSSQRSRMIVFGDCVGQFERLVQNRKKDFIAAPGLQKPVQQRGTSQSETQKNYAAADEKPSSNHFAAASEIVNSVRSKKNQDLFLDKARKGRHFFQKALGFQLTPMVNKNSDSLFSLSMTEEPSKASPRQLISALGEIVKLSEQKLPEIKVGSQTQLMSYSKLGFGQDSPRKKAAMETQAMNLMLLSSKMNILSPKEGRNQRKKNTNSTTTGESKYEHPLLRSNPDLIDSGDLKIQESQEISKNSGLVGKDSTTDGNLSTSYHALPAINHNFSMQALESQISQQKISSPHEQQVSQEIESKQQPSATHLQNIAHVLSINGDQMLKSLTSESIVWEMNNSNVNKRARNQAKSHVRTSKGQKEQSKQQQIASPKLWSMTSSQLKDEIEYNYGGYISRQNQNSNTVGASFFNSKKRDEHSQDSMSSQLLRQAHEMKKVAKRRQREAGKKGQSKTASRKQETAAGQEVTQSELGDVLGQLEDQMGTQKQTKKEQHNQNKSSMIVQLTVPLKEPQTANVSTSEGETILLDKHTKRTDQDSRKGTKSRCGRNKNSKEHYLTHLPKMTASNSINKITITPPLMVPNIQGVQYLAVPQKQLRGYPEASQQRNDTSTSHLKSTPGQSQQELATLNLANQPSFTDIVTQGPGLPSLAAAQARQMTRKQNNVSNLQVGRDLAIKLAQQKIFKQGAQSSAQQSGISGIFGDSLQKSTLQQQQQFYQKQALFKLKHSKKYHYLAKSNNLKLNSSDNLPVEGLYANGMMIRSPTHTIIGQAQNEGHQQDEQCSVQKSLYDSASLGQLDDGSVHALNQQKSMMSQSSGGHQLGSGFPSNMHSHFGMTLKQPIYGGEVIQPSGRDPPNSSINVCQPMEKNDYGSSYRIAVPTGQINVKNPSESSGGYSQHSTQKKSNEANLLIDESKQAKQSTQKTMIAVHNVESPQETSSGVDQEINYGNVAQKKHKRNKVTPFQQFQESISRLDMPSREIPTATYMMLNTPGFKHEEQTTVITSAGLICEKNHTTSTFMKHNNTRRSGLSSSFKKQQHQSQLGKSSKETRFGHRSIDGSGEANSQNSHHWDAAASVDSNQKLKQQARKQIAAKQKSTKFSPDVKKVNLNQGLIQSQAQRRLSLSSDKFASQVQDSKMLSVVKINVPPSGGEYKLCEKGKVIVEQAQNVEVNQLMKQDQIAHTSLGQSELIEDQMLSKMASYPVINGFNSKAKARNQVSASSIGPLNVTQSGQIKHEITHTDSQETLIQFTGSQHLQPPQLNSQETMLLSASEEIIDTEKNTPVLPDVPDYQDL